MHSDMDSAIAWVKKQEKLDPADYLEPDHTNKASMLRYAVSCGEFPESSFLDCTFSISVLEVPKHTFQFVKRLGVIVLTINEDLSELMKDIQVRNVIKSIPLRSTTPALTNHAAAYLQAPKPACNN